MGEKINLSAIDLYVISRVKEMRLEKGFTQAQLAYKLDISYGFVGQAESPKHRAKYNINHLNKLAKIFECEFKDFFPPKPL